jgi:SAM-dependent methyltransferase
MESPARVYERVFVPAVFAPLAERLLARAAPRPGEVVLDLACGTGAVARRVAPLVGTPGRIAAVDLRAGMLAVARALPVAVEWLVADAAALPFPDETFDLVVCQQGLQFFGDRGAALAEARRVLARGGRLVASVWRSLEEHELWRALVAAEARHLGPLGVVTEDELAAPFSLGDAAELRRLVEAAGYSAVGLDQLTFEAVFSAERFVRDVELAYAAVVPGLAAGAAAFDAFVSAVERETRAVVNEHRRGGVVAFPLRAHVVHARR